MKKLEIDDNKCIGCGSCVYKDNEHFDFNDSKTVSIISQNNLDSQDLQEAIEYCPTGAITLSNNCCDTQDCHCEECDK